MAPCTAEEKMMSYDKSSLGIVHHCTPTKDEKAYGAFSSLLGQSQNSTVQLRAEVSSSRELTKPSGLYLWFLAVVNSPMQLAHHGKPTISHVFWLFMDSVSWLYLRRIHVQFPCSTADTQCFGMKKTVWWFSKAKTSATRILLLRAQLCWYS